MQAEIGLIGLGVMGANLALNIAEKNFPIAVFNRTIAETREFYHKAGRLQSRITPCETLADFAAAIRPPRPIIIMIKAGVPVDEQMATLQPYLGSGDIMIDAGNANFHDTMRRFKKFENSGLTFMGMGVSGGAEGARHGPSIMVGSTSNAFARIAPVLQSIAAQHNGEPCVAWLGENGAGHFVKTIHNGIEYADMQMIAEIYGILRDGLKMPADEISTLFEQWNKGRLNSYLIEITSKILKTLDDHSCQPLVDVILDKAGQKGTGKWSVIEAQNLGVAATSIEAAVAARLLSGLKETRLRAAKILQLPPLPSLEQFAVSMKRFSDKNCGKNKELERLTEPSEVKTALEISDRQAFFKSLEQALLAAKIGAYAQGFATLSAASQAYEWNLPLATIARIWRAGCIIRSQLLDEIANAFETTPDAENLALTPSFSAILHETDASLRQVIATATMNRLPIPALSSALNYFDLYRQERSTANLIQAQRDFFGAHGFERLDGKPFPHGPWHAHP